MYGEEKLNNHYIIRYGLTKEFFEGFAGLKHLDIEIPLCLIRHFHIWIQPFVDLNLSNKAYVQTLQRKHHLYSAEDIQHRLQGKKPTSQQKKKKGSKKVIVMPARFVDLALQRFYKDNVLLIITTAQEGATIKEKKLPNHFDTFYVSKALAKVQLSAPSRKLLTEKLDRTLNKHRYHPVFGKDDFGKWLRGYTFRMAKMLEAFDLLFQEYEVGVVLDHLEITVPANITSLLSLKYGAPFIILPQLLLSDRSILPTRAAYHFVWGVNYKEWLQKRGVESSKIKIVGNLRFEQYQTSPSMTKAEFRSRLNIPRSNLIITFTSQPLPEEVNHTILKWIHAAAKNLPVTFLIKPHPSDKVDYSAYIQIPKKIILPASCDLYNILANTDIVTTVSSNTAIEAAIMQKGILILQPTIPYHYEYHNNDFNSHLVKASAGAPIYNEQQLIQEIRELLNNKRRSKDLYMQGQAFLENTISSSSYPSPSTRISQLVHTLIK